MITAKTELRKVLHSLQRYIFKRTIHTKQQKKKFILKIAVDEICSRSARVSRKNVNCQLDTRRWLIDTI